jgi:hypothetical protein
MTIAVSKRRIMGPITKELCDAACDEMLEKLGAEVVSESDILDEGKIAGRKIEAKVVKNGNRVRFEFRVAEELVYVVGALGQPSWEGWGKVDQFFGSLEILK